jgi:MurNAc alpha-1-phosphate uridylyltransferase
MPAAIGAMILAAGRGERMRPLSDATPKPLLEAGGKPLIVWQIEALARAGLRDIVINAAHLAERLRGALGDGAALGVRLRWSIEAEALETAGGIATAAPLLPDGPALIVSGDIWTAYDYAPLVERAWLIAHTAAPPRVHLVMVPNPPCHPDGDFMLPDPPPAPAAPAAPAASAGRAGNEAAPRATATPPVRVGLRADPDGASAATCRTFGNIGIYDLSLFHAIPRGTRAKLAPLFARWIAAGLVSGELYTGPWANVGTPADLAALDRRLRHNGPELST